MNKKITHKGISIIEMVISIAIIGIIASFISLVILRPIESYNVTKLRSELTDQAYIITHKIKNDVRGSLPNSLRITNNGNKVFLEMLLISEGGRYRTQNNATLNGDILDFTINDNSFDILSHPITFNGGEKIVIANKGITNYNAYNNDNIADYAGTTGTPVSNISISPKKFPVQSEYQTFYIVNKVLTYVCDKDSKTITKYWGYNISSSQPNNTLASPLATSNKALLSNSVKDCSFIFNLGDNSRNGQLTSMIQLENNGQTITLYGDTNVPNL